MASRASGWRQDVLAHDDLHNLRSRDEDRADVPEIDGDDVLAPGMAVEDDAHTCRRTSSRTDTARDLAGLHQLDGAVPVVDLEHRLEILGSHASEQVLQGDLIHGKVDALDGPPEAAIPEPLRRLDSVGVAAVGSVMSSNMKAAIASPFSPTSSRTRRAKPFGRPPGFPLTPGVKPRPVTPPSVVPVLFSTISTGSQYRLVGGRSRQI